MSGNFCWWMGAVTLLILPAAERGLRAQDAQTAQQEAIAELPEIQDEPRTIDPATLMPEPLTVRARVNFSNTSLSEIAAWLGEQQNLVVLFKRNAMADVGIVPSELVSDRLDDEPVYFLLDRLRALGLGWYYENDILYITSDHFPDAGGTLG